MVATTLPNQGRSDINILNASRGVRLQSLVYIRWLAVLGQAFAIILVHFFLDYKIPLVPAVLLVSASALLNILVSLSSRPAKRLSDRGAIVYLFYDALQLTGLLYLTGGLTNPFSLLFLVPVTISATNLSLKGTMFLGLTTIAAVTLLAVFH
jgi:two-component system sensor histidine kinase RegB